jgi:hypothetical protein
MRRSIAVCLACACLASACVDDSSTITAVYSPTLLTADPSTFLGTIRCGSELRQYVVTLFDVSTGTAMNLGSAPPTDCTKPTTFGSPKIASGYAYTAEIDGYDVDVVPVGGADSGSRTMTDATTMMLVLPRWTTSCGQVSFDVDGQTPTDAFNPIRYPTITRPNIEVIFHGCFPLGVAPPPDAGPPDGPADTTDAAEETPEAAPGR